jgi:hypothetical protein
MILDISQFSLLPLEDEQLLVSIFILFNIASILEMPSIALEETREALLALFAKERDVRILIDVDRI